MTSAEVPLSGDELDLWNSLRIIRGRWLLILLTVGISVGLTAFYTKRQTKIYRATTVVRIETQAPRVLGRSVEAVDEMGTGTLWSNVEYYETQYKIMSSRDVASRVVKEYKLNGDPEFMGVPEADRRSFEPVSVETAARRLQDMITIEPVKESRLVMVHADNRDPQRAQLYSNAIAKAYLDNNLETILQSTVDAVDWLSKQLDDAQAKLNTSEQNVYDYRKEHGIMSVSLEERQNMLTAQMTALATKLTEAKAERIAIQSEKKAMEDLVSIEDPMAIPLEKINTNALIQQLKQEYGTLSMEYSELSERYGAKFPRMVELQAKLERIKGDIQREVKNVLMAVDAKLAAAKDTENELRKSLDTLRRQAMDLGEKGVAYHRLERERKNNEEIYQILMGRSKEADLSRLLRVNNVHILDPALLPTEPIRPRLHWNLTLALIVGLLVGVGLALLLELSDRTIRTQEDIESRGVAFLGIVPSIGTAALRPYQKGYANLKKAKRSHPASRKQTKKGDVSAFDLFVHENPKSQVSESCRAIRTNLLFMSANRSLKTLLVTSPSPQEGKTTVAVNLATVMAQAGSRVLLVDTDMRRPRLHRTFRLSPKKGISSMVLGESSVEDSIHATSVDHLDVLPCGPIPPNPAELIHMERFGKVLSELAAMYDHLILDSPPVGVVTDAAILSKLVDGTVLIVKSLRTSREAFKHAVGVLRDIDSSILGAVLNDLDFTNRKYGQHYYHEYFTRYGEYYESEEESDPREDSRPPSSSDEPTKSASS